MDDGCEILFYSVVFDFTADEGSLYRQLHHDNLRTIFVNGAWLRKPVILLKQIIEKIRFMSLIRYNMLRRLCLHWMLVLRDSFLRILS